MFTANQFSNKHGLSSPYIICLLCLQLISLVINMDCLHHTLFVYCVTALISLVINMDCLHHTLFVYCVYSFNQFSNKHGLSSPYIICLLCLQLISLVINMDCLHHTLFVYCVYSFNQFSNKHGLSSPYIICLLCLLLCLQL